VAEFHSSQYINDFERLRQVGQEIEEAMEHDPEQCAELEGQLDEYLQLANELHLYPGEERVASHPINGILLAVPAYIGYVLHLPIIWATRFVVPRKKTKLHALGSKRVSWGILFTILWYVIIAAMALYARSNWFKESSLLWVGLGIFAMACCGALASRKLRHVNLAIRRIAGSSRFKRYVEQGEQLVKRLSMVSHSRVAEP
jgi:hypothetical protein